MPLFNEPLPSPSDPHAGGHIVTAGPPVDQAAGVLLMLHGRGATAQSILDLYPLLDAPRVHAIAPQASGNTWYPHSFLAPIEANQPYLDSALWRVRAIVDDLVSAGISTDRLALLGFSQGACLAAEFVARHPRHYGAAMILSGGLIGPPGTPRDYPGSLAGTPVLLAGADPDPHVPFERVHETERAFVRLAAQVQVRRYPGMPHTINHDELDACRALLRPFE